MPNPSNQFSAAGLAPSAIMQALGAVGMPFGIGREMRNIGKAREPGIGRRGRAALLGVQQRRADAAQAAQYHRTSRGRAAEDVVAAIGSSDSGRAGDTASRADATDASAANPGTEL